MRKIYLADLTHTGQSVASNVFPLAIGLLASYLQGKSEHEYDIELFKYPDDLAERLRHDPPDVLGFSNYSWNCEISYKFTSLCKQHSPDTVIVWGGPNYGLTDAEIQQFWLDYADIDFYLIKEGEEAFVNLLNRLEAVDFDKHRLKRSDDIPYNAHFRGPDQNIVQGEIAKRIKDLSVIASPYLLGLMDKFFDNILIPMIHTTRGCPFSCSFCSEGNAYYNRVAQRSNLENELEYIAQRRGTVQDLLITDANFGMFPQDQEKADLIAEMKAKYGWPNKILVSTGKNKKEKVIEVARKLDGALSITASLQSTDKEILKTIKRSNISSDALQVIVNESKQSNTPTYTELILGLPGDSYIKHVQSLRDVLGSGLGIVRIYQLILLPQTELATPEFREKYEMQTVFRVNPRSFGKYEGYDEPFSAVEFEEICVGTNTLSRDDYLECRQLDLSVEVLHNTSLFKELLPICQHYGIVWFEFIYQTHKNILNSDGHLRQIYADYCVDCFANTFDSRASLISYFDEHIDELLEDSGGTNEMAKGKARVVFEAMQELHEMAFSTLKKLISEYQELHHDSQEIEPVVVEYLEELKQLSLLQKHRLDDRNVQTSHFGLFDFGAIAQNRYEFAPDKYRKQNPIELQIGYSSEQKQYVDAYFKQYGTDIEGLGRTLMRIDMARFIKPVSNVPDYLEDAS